MNHTPITIIYALINPINSKVFYIGATTQLEKRLKAHISDARLNRGNPQKNFIINEIIINGFMPLIEELEICHGYLAPMYAERFWIHLYTVQKHPLTNLYPQRDYSIKILSCRSKYYNKKMKRLYGVKKGK